MKSDSNPVLRKRTQIIIANRTMLIWVACSSVVLGVSLVGIIFLTRMLVYNENVLTEKNKTVSTLKLDNQNIEKLKEQIRVLETNSDLASVRATDDEKSIQVVLDALPSEANSMALGASLEKNLLANVSGIDINSMNVIPVAGVESLENGSNSNRDNYVSDISDNYISFSFEIKGGVESMRQVLLNLERSIRTMNVVALNLSIDDDGVMTMFVNGHAFYEPSVELKLIDKAVK